MDVDNLDYKVDKTQQVKYGISKAGNALHAMEYAKRYKKDGIVSIVSCSQFQDTNRMTDYIPRHSILVI